MSMIKNLKLKRQSTTSILKYLLIGILLTIAPVFAQAQSKAISGTVTDEQNLGLPGVTVTVKGTKTVAQTDANGKFVIKISPKDQLVFAYIGFETSTVSVGTKSVVNVSLNSKTNDLDEIVVIGYGTVKRKDLTGTVGSVSMADINKAPVRSFDEALAGRVAGVQVNSADGQPGSGVNIVIRGNNSVTQDNSPLYVVDGFLIENPDNNVINPADIATMDILKDASATAIYGARGANGVIVITTKKGKEGKAVFAFSSSTGVQENINPIEMMSPVEFLKYQLELNPAATGSPSTATQLYLTPKGLTLDTYQDFYKNERGIDWQNLTQRTALIQNNNLSVTGGTKKFKYALSGSTINQDGILINSNYQRYQGRAVLDYNITSKLKVGINTNYSVLKQLGLNPAVSSNGATTNVMFAVWGSRPIFTDPNDIDSFQDPDVNSANDYRINPVINLTNIYRLNTTRNLTLNSYVEYQFLKSFKFRSTFGITENRVIRNSFNNSQTQFGSNVGSANGVNGSVINLNSSNWLNENTMTWNKKINKKSKIDVLGGFTVQKSLSKTFGQSANQLPNEELGLNGLDQGIQVRVDTVNSIWTMASFLGRINYNYNSKYLLTASMRADGSSRFPRVNHWGYFPSGAASWVFQKENFLKNSKVLSEGKMRVSYGVTGNNRVGDFSYLSTYFNPVAATYTFNNQYVPGVIAAKPDGSSALGNSNLRWESTEQLDAGIDLGFFKQRITLGADVYVKTTKDLLLNAFLPPSSGFPQAFRNVGSVENRGLELTLNTKNIQTKNFSWTSSANISFNKNKLLALTGDGDTNIQSPIRWDNGWQGTPAYIAKIGQPLGQMFGLKSLGTYKYDDFNATTTGATTVYVLKPDVASNGNATRANIQPGDVKYADISGPNGVPDGLVNSNDYTVIGRGIPIHTGGFSNNFSYKNFDLNVFFQWSYGNDIMNANNIIFNGNRNNNAYLNQFASYKDRWTPENSNSNIPRTRGYLGTPSGYGSQWVEDGSYLRLKTVSLGYNVDKEFIKKFRLKSARFYVSGQNLITWTNYSGSDPEVNLYNSALTSGFDYSSYPRARTIVFGTNITF